MSSPPAASGARLIRAVAAVSGAYDIILGITLLVGRSLLAAWLRVPEPVPPLHAELNGLFLLAIGVGYVLPWRDPNRYRGYLWVMGPLLKGAGAAAFVLDHVFRHSPAAFLLFALADGALALVTLAALLAWPRGDGDTETTTRQLRP